MRECWINAIETWQKKIKREYTPLANKVGTVRRTLYAPFTLNDGMIAEDKVGLYVFTGPTCEHRHTSSSTDWNDGSGSGG